MLRAELRQRFSVAVTLGAGDVTKEVMPAVTGVQYGIINAIIICLTSAAQAVYVGDSSGTVKALSVAASYPLHGQVAAQLLEGLLLTAGESIVVKPAAAGPSFHAVVEGFIIRS